MAIQKTEALVLKREDIRETSVLVTLYTKDLGKIKGLVKGLRSPTTRYGSFLQPFSYNEVVFYQRIHGELHLISQCELLDLFPAIRRDLKKCACAYYLVELLDEATVLHDKNLELFKSLLSALKLLSDEDEEKVARIFEAKLLRSLGLMPHLSSCGRCGRTKFGEIRFSPSSGGLLCESCSREEGDAIPVLKGTVASITHMEQTGWEKATHLDLTQKVAENLKVILRRFLDFQIGKRLKSLDFLEKIG